VLRAMVVPIATFAVLAVLWVTQCSGPRPTVIGAPQVQAPARPGDPLRVQATVRNDGPGHGEVRVTFRLRDPASGEAYQDDETVQLDRGETARVVGEIRAPPGSYEPEVQVEYPPG
jgi:hypothetical protein